jgi:hypothetical protein
METWKARRKERESSGDQQMMPLLSNEGFSVKATRQKP